MSLNLLFFLCGLLYILLLLSPSSLLFTPFVFLIQEHFPHPPREAVCSLKAPTFPCKHPSLSLALTTLKPFQPQYIVSSLRVRGAVLLTSVWDRVNMLVNVKKDERIGKVPLTGPRKFTVKGTHSCHKSYGFVITDPLFSHPLLVCSPCHLLQLLLPQYHSPRVPSTTCSHLPGSHWPQSTFLLWLQFSSYIISLQGSLCSQQLPIANPWGLCFHSS